MHYTISNPICTVYTNLCDCLLCTILETIKSVYIHISFHYNVISYCVAIRPGFTETLPKWPPANAPRYDCEEVVRELQLNQQNEN